MFARRDSSVAAALEHAAALEQLAAQHAQLAAHFNEIALRLHGIEALLLVADNDRSAQSDLAERSRSLQLSVRALAQGYAEVRRLGA